MTRTALAIAIATLLTGTAALAQQPAPKPASAPTATTAAAKPASAKTKAAATNKTDQAFLKDFALANAVEVEAGKLAFQKAGRTEVKNFAKHMVEDHSKTLEKVQAIASKSNVEVTQTPDAAQKEKAAMLGKTNEKEFDQAFLKTMVEDHEKAVALLQKEIKSGKNAEVKKLASEALPDVKKHLKTAKDMHELLLAMAEKSASDR